ncbi:MAG: UDP-N-acetyl-D-glucosamine dehydrogenase [Bacteroidetes bacterium GWE2_39_28]|nr:MAG: UDP-N-acetyl-D-glucosamine dehydrogenase [Bacteroidetes bacterium GWE2_39_28]OFY13348.1 MAG: UDP-N-acetyl-D-glucosamine dehydrogenase [Bacteroidetes bacterium GWF2_39_10]OFZ09722.1 MAG: UDP-N-acetyl-D-glucosamine dehydrogenase [Bacteroidetes bacterium RIFOXYC2_FULL_39_11]HCT94540.1 UDP-N-acetyl-D-glucosamine dehydrogenase [Rikenellaceae bacterium]
MSELYHEILTRIRNNQFLVGVVGLGYVGLPLAVSFSNKKVSTIGFDKSIEKCTKVNSKINYIGDVNDEELIKAVNGRYLEATTDFCRLKDCDAIIICVPTPLDKFRKPNMEFIEAACIEIGQNMKVGTFISLESTTYPTTTEEFMLPIIEKESGLIEGRDFWLAFSPERVDPGNKQYGTRNTPKVIGAISKEGLEIGKSIYEYAVDTIHTVSSPKVAEMVKILENTYRLINISLINELALLCGKMEINIWEVIDAAKTKPYGFQAFYPGPGIGGHCIPLDPFYLEHIAKKFNFDLSMINTAGHIDMMMPHRMSIKISTALNKHKKSINGSKILFLGVAYKPNIDDERESPALKIIEEVANKGGIVNYHDPFISKIKTNSYSFKSVELSREILNSSDCVVITTNHDAFNIDFIVDNSMLIVDLRNTVKGVYDKVYKL